MAHTFEELKKMTVAQLKEIAKGIEHDAVKGHSTMHKEKLLLALCTALGIDAHEHHEAEGLDLVKVKAQFKKLRARRDAALKAKDAKQLKLVRRERHRLKRVLRKATV